MKLTSILGLSALFLGFCGACTLECQKGWEANRDSCYKIFNTSDPIDHSQAVTACAKENAFLTSVGDQEEKDFVTGMASIYKNRGDYRWNPWIGLVKKDGKWMWEDGTVTPFVSWGKHEPNNKGGNEYCGHIIITDLGNYRAQSGDVNDVNCTARLHTYICKKKAVELATSTRATPSTTTSTTQKPTTPTTTITPSTVPARELPRGTSSTAGANSNSASQCSCKTSITEPILISSTSASSTPFLTFTKPNETVTSCTTSTIEMISTQSSTTTITSVVTITTTMKKENGISDTIEAEKLQSN